jgi:hypothetical protein
VELAPEIFHCIRQIQNIDEKLIKVLFSQENLQNLAVEVAVTKGGSFYVKPAQGGIFIKSMTKAGYKLMQDFLPDYYRYLLMNPNTHLSPILGAFSINLIKDENTLPVFFTIQKYVNDYDPLSLEQDDLSLNFDIKGTVNGRRILNYPREILDFDNVIANREKF